MAKTPKKPAKTYPLVAFHKEPKTNVIRLTRENFSGDTLRLVFPAADGADCARLSDAGQSESESVSHLWLDINELRFLARAIPELLNEMERAGVK